MIASASLPTDSKGRPFSETVIWATKLTNGSIRHTVTLQNRKEEATFAVARDEAEAMRLAARTALPVVRKTFGF